jgi:hypothetical protein
MDVRKIQEFSRKHDLLRNFYTMCNCNDVCLIARESASVDVELDQPTTQLIISDVRVSLLKRISEAENKIREEAGGG